MSDEIRSRPGDQQGGHQGMGKGAESGGPMGKQSMGGGTKGGAGLYASAVEHSVEIPGKPRGSDNTQPTPSNIGVNEDAIRKGIVSEPDAGVRRGEAGPADARLQNNPNA